MCIRDRSGRDRQSRLVAFVVVAGIAAAYEHCVAFAAVRPTLDHDIDGMVIKLDHTAVYERLARDCDGIISIHASREMFDSWSHAQVAAQPYTGRCRVIPIDSQNLSTAQAMLVRLTAQAAAQQPTLDDLVRIARGAVDQLYTVFTVDSVEYVMHHRILPPSQSILGAMLNIKPVLSMEHGRLIAIEKVRTRAQAIERLVEFVMEFTEVIDAAIMQPTTGLTEQGKLLQERLLVDFPGMSFIHTRYGASLAAFIGLDAIGLTVMENPNTRIDHDDY